MRFPDGATLTVLPRRGRDEYGDPTAPAGRSHTIRECGVAVLSSVEQAAQRRHGVITELQVVLPPDSDILDTDLVTLDDPRLPGTWRVEGGVKAYRTATGVDRGIVLTLRQTTA